MTDVPQSQTGSVVAKLFRSEQGGHEKVVLCQDRASGLKAVIALHSTALGPALGGTRFFPYASDDEAVEDALNLARGVTYKNALAGLDYQNNQNDIARQERALVILALDKGVDCFAVGRY